MTTLDLPTRSAVLAEFLQKRGLSGKEVEGCLIEFVLRSWVDAKRVREWCSEITQVLELIPVPLPLREALQSPPLDILLPFTRIPSNAFFPSAEPPFPPPLIPQDQLSRISSKQLIESLSELSFRNHYDGSRPFCDEPLVFEVCLEYISCCWRSSPGEGEDGLIDWIIKKLTEVDFELQLQGHPTTIGLTILPIFHKIRFQLGFVTISQLITRLNSLTPTYSTSPSYASSLCSEEAGTSTSLSGSTFGVAQQQPLLPTQLIRAWVQRRLCTGVSYQSILDEMTSVKTRLNDIASKDALTAVLADFGIRYKVDEATCDQFGLLWLSPSPIIAAPTEKRIRPLPLLAAKMSRKRSVSHRHTPKWFSHMRNNSSSSKLRLHTSEHRHPSLPSSSPITPQSTGFLTSPSTVTFPDESLLRQPIPPERPRTTFHDDLTSSLMSLTEPEDVRTVLLNQLMEMRYHVHGHEDEGWFLGGGKEQAEELMCHLEKRMIGRKDLMGFREIFDSMRSAFDLGTAPSLTLPRPGTFLLTGGSKRNTTLSLSDVATHRRTVSFEFDLNTYLPASSPPLIIDSPTSSDENDVGHNRDHNDEQIKGTKTLTPFSPRRGSAGAQSVLTMASLLTSDSQPDIQSRMSCFEIQQAKREFPLKSRAVELYLPTTPPASAHMNHWANYRRTSISVPELATDSKYTRLPPRVGSLRRYKLRGSRSMTRLRSLGAESDPSTLSPIPAIPLQGHASTSYHSIPLTPADSQSPSAFSDNSSGAQCFSVAGETTTTPIAYAYDVRVQHDDPLPTLSSESTLFSSPDSPLVATPNTRRLSLGMVSKSRRNMHRHFAIFNGEQVSPKREVKDLQIDVADISTPTCNLRSLSNDGSSDENHSTFVPEAGEDRVSSLPSTPKVPPRVSSLQTLPRVSFGPSPSTIQGRLTGRSTFSSLSTATATASNLPLTEVLELMSKRSSSALTLWEVEEALHRSVEKERKRVAKAGRSWDSEARSKVVWLIEQVAVLLDDPIYIAPISRVIASLDPALESSSSSNSPIPPASCSPKPRSLYRAPRHAQSQPQFSSYISRALTPSSLFRSLSPPYQTHVQNERSGSSISPTPHPMGPRPDVIRRHTGGAGTCFSISSLSSASSRYSTQSIEVIDSPLPSPNPERYDMRNGLNLNRRQYDHPLITKMSPGQYSAPPEPTAEYQYIYLDQFQTRVKLGREETEPVDPELGYRDWETPLPERIEFPIPRIRVRMRGDDTESLHPLPPTSTSISSATGTGVEVSNGIGVERVDEVQNESWNPVEELDFGPGSMSASMSTSTGRWRNFSEGSVGTFGQGRKGSLVAV